MDTTTVFNLTPFQAAKLHGCSNPINSQYRSALTDKRGWELHGCFEFASRIKAEEDYDYIVHFLHDSLKDAICVGLVNCSADRRRWAFLGTHKIGKCPYCEYMEVKNEGAYL